jgi:hypothetical protein
MYYFTYFSTYGALVQSALLYYLSLMFNRDDIKDGARNFLIFSTVYSDITYLFSTKRTNDRIHLINVIHFVLFGTVFYNLT